MRFLNKNVLSLILSVLFLSQGIARAGTPPADASLPDCLIDGAPAEIDNARVLHLKFNTKNQYKDRAYVSGTVTRLFDRNGDHKHFEIRIGGGEKDVIEIIYNTDFGKPAVWAGDQVIVCGDYITSYAKSGRYDASPSKALIHWVHENERGTEHPDGFVAVNGRELYGFGSKAIPLRTSANE